MMSDQPHRRFNPLQRTWVLCSPHRAQRPWQGQVEAASVEQLPHYDPACYLCPGNTRANGDQNPKYESTFIFENDFAAVKPPEEASAPSTSALSDASSSLMRTEAAHGRCYVIAYTPSHANTMAECSTATVDSIISAWRKLYTDVSKLEYVNYIQIFENKGAAMGCSNPHPHGQSWTLSYIPTLPATGLESMHMFADRKDVKDNAPRLADGRPSLLLSYAHEELTPQVSDRVIFKSEHFVALVPYWAFWPFETILLPYKRQVPALVDLSEAEQTDLADCLRRLTCRMDNLFKTSFPYSMGIYQTPVAGDSFNDSVSQLHFSFYPPLLRSATVKKFNVGFEMFSENQRDITAEAAASRLREQPEQHFKHQ